MFNNLKHVLILWFLAVFCTYELWKVTQFIFESFGILYVREDNTRDISFFLLIFDIPFFYIIYNLFNNKRGILLLYLFLFLVLKIELFRIVISPFGSLNYFFYRIKYIHSINCFSVCLIYLFFSFYSKYFKK